MGPESTNLLTVELAMKQVGQGQFHKYETPGQELEGT